MSGQLVVDAPLAHLRWSPTAGGNGRLALLLHGVGGGRQAWDDAGSGTGAAQGTGETLAAAGFITLAVDFPGYGLSAAIEPYDLVGLAGAVLRLIEAQRQGPAIVVGHSMGGMVAQELAALAPQAVAALVLAGTSPAFGKPGGDWQQGFLQARFAPLDSGWGMAGLARQLVPTMVAPGTPAPVIATAQTLMAGVPEATYRAAVSALVGFDRRAGLANIAVPTLVITGAHDATAAPDVARRMAQRIPGARLAIVPGAGHLLPLEMTSAFNTALLEFLAAAALTA